MDQGIRVVSTCPAESCRSPCFGASSSVFFWDQHTRGDLGNGVVEQLCVIRAIDESPIQCNRPIAPFTELLVGFPWHLRSKKVIGRWFELQ